MKVKVETKKVWKKCDWHDPIFKKWNGLIFIKRSKKRKKIFLLLTCCFNLISNFKYFIFILIKLNYLSALRVIWSKNIISFILKIKSGPLFLALLFLKNEREKKKKFFFCFKLILITSRLTSEPTVIKSKKYYASDFSKPSQFLKAKFLNIDESVYHFMIFIIWKD